MTDSGITIADVKVGVAEALQEKRVKAYVRERKKALERRQKDPEKARAYQRKWVAEHLEQHQANQRRYQLKNRVRMNTERREATQKIREEKMLKTIQERGDMETLVVSNPSNPLPVLLKTPAVAAILGVNVRTLWRLRNSGCLPLPVRIGGGTILRWDKAKLLDWIDRGCPKINDKG